MKKALKIFGCLILLAVVLLGVASVALRFLLPPEKAKALVLKQLTTHLKREVRIGDVSVGVISGLTLLKLEVSEAPDFSKGTFISSDRFSLHLALLPLIFKRIEVKQLVLDHPVISVVRYPDGKTFNFSDLIAASTPTTAVVRQRLRPSRSLFAIDEAYAASPGDTSPKGAEPSFALVISQAQITKGVVRFLDRSPAKQSVEIDPLDLKLKNVSLTSPFSVQAYLKAKARDVVATLKIAGDADLGSGSFKVKDCELSSGGSTVTLEGKASQLKSNRPSVDLTLHLKEFKPSTLASFVALPPALKFEGPMVGQARIKGDQAKMDFSGKLDLENVKVVYAKQFSKPAQAPLGVSWQGTLSELQDMTITEVKATLGSMQVKGYGKILAIKSPQPQVGLHVESNAFQVMDVAGFLPGALPAGLTMKGPAQFAADISGTQTSSHVAAKCDAKDLQVVFGDKFKKPAGMPFRLSMTGELVRQKFSIESLNTTLGSIEVSGKGAVQVAAEPPTFQMALKTNTFPLADLSAMVPMLAAYRLGGSALTDVRISGSAAVPQAAGTLTLQDGSARYELSELTRLSTTLTYTQQDVNIPKLTGKLNGSDFTIKLTGRRLTTHPDVTLDGYLTELDLAKVLPPPAPVPAAGATSWIPQAWAAAPPVTPPMNLAGQLTVRHIKDESYDAKDMDMKWNLTNVTPDLSQVGGTASLKQGVGIIRDLEKLAERTKSASIVLNSILVLQKLEKTISQELEKKGVKGVKLPNLKKIPFDGIQGDYLFQSGIMDIKVFQLSGHDLSISNVGTIGLAGVQPLDLRATMKGAPGAVGGTVGELLNDADGRATFNITIKGTASNPDVNFDFTQIKQKAMKKIGQAVGEQLMKGLGIGGASQGSPSPATPSDNAEPSAPPPNSAKDLEKALRNIFK